MKSQDRDACFRAVAAIVMALQEGGAKQNDIIDALDAAGRCEARLREEASRESNA
jgi:hypothetical protein